MKKSAVVILIIACIGMALSLSACVTKDGQLYVLYDAYDNGFLTEEDMKTVGAYFDTGRTAKGTVGKATESAMKKAYRQYRHWDKNTKVEYKFYGKYNGSYVVLIGRNVEEMAKNYTSETVMDNFAGGYNLMVWTDRAPAEITLKGQFYSLQQAADNDFLTAEDLQTVADYLHNYDYSKVNIDRQVSLAIKDTYARRNGIDRKELKYLFYGEYNGCYVVGMRTEYDAVIAIDPPPVTIKGVVFDLKSPVFPLVWKEDN